MSARAPADDAGEVTRAVRDRIEATMQLGDAIRELDEVHGEVARLRAEVGEGGGGADGDRLTTSQIASEYGISPSTFRAYVTRKQAPAADGHHDKRTPYWLRSTLEEWRPINPQPTTEHGRGRSR